MDKLAAMTAFAKVVALGSYAEAGRHLGLTRSAVSKAVMELEQVLGARLLDRTTRRVSPTEAGRAYYERCLDILASVEETELQVSRLHEEPGGVLRINAPVSFGALYLGEAIAAFMGAYGELKIELTLNDRFIDPIEEGVDVTIRIGALADSSLIARKLAPARRVLAAAPAICAGTGRPGRPRTSSSIAASTTVTPRRCRNGSSSWRWRARLGADRLAALLQQRRRPARGGARGQGIALLPTFLVGRDLAAGKLRLVLGEYAPTALGIYALYAPNRYLAAKTRVLIDFLVARFGDEPDWDRFAQAAMPNAIV